MNKKKQSTQQRDRYSMAGKAWDAVEKRALAQAVKAGEGLGLLAVMHSRTKKEIREEIDRQGLTYQPVMSVRKEHKTIDMDEFIRRYEAKENWLDKEMDERIKLPYT